MKRRDELEVAVALMFGLATFAGGLWILSRAGML